MSLEPASTRPPPRAPRRIGLRAQPAFGAGPGAQLGDVADLLGLAPDAVERARATLGLLGDAGRRSLVEALASRPGPATARLPAMTGLSDGDIFHRLRSLRRARLMTRDRHHVYRVDPAGLAALSAYADLLMTAAALGGATGGRP